MNAELKMSVDERRKYLGLMKPRYAVADKKGRGALLDEMEQVTQMHRKSLIRLLSASDLKRKPRQRPRGRRYKPEVEDAIRLVSEALDHICAERLKPALPQMALHLANFGELHLTPTLLADLKAISVATVGRMLRRHRQDTPRLPRRPPQPTNRYTKAIPARRLPWNETQPGHFETDLVHHCGSSSEGVYVHTLQMVDIATGWSERVAIYGRTQTETEAGFARLRGRLPMPVLQLHPDNGSEFLNDHIIRCWQEASAGLSLSRSRPWIKNDNRFVEQKNRTLVRAYLGDLRYDSRWQCQQMNALYDLMWVYYNLFQPVMRLKEKVTVTAKDGTSRTRHQYDQARTPFERLCETGAISEQKKAELEQLIRDTNPRELRDKINRLLAQLWASANDLPVLPESERWAKARAGGN